MGNGSASKVMGIGDICLKTDIGYSLTLKEVRHGMDIRLNVLSSAGKLDELGNCCFYL